MHVQFLDLRRDQQIDEGCFVDDTQAAAWGQALADRNRISVYAVTENGDAFYLTPVHMQRALAAA